MTRMRRTHRVSASVRTIGVPAFALALAAVLAAGAAAQPAPGAAGAGPGYPKVYDSSLKFEPKDIAGIWTPNGAGTAAAVRTGPE